MFTSLIEAHICYCYCISTCKAGEDSVFATHQCPGDRPWGAFVLLFILCDVYLWLFLLCSRFY